MSDKEKQLTEELVKGMREEELKIVLENIPDDILWRELKERFDSRSKIVSGLNRLIESRP